MDYTTNVKLPMVIDGISGASQSNYYYKDIDIIVKKTPQFNDAPIIKGVEDSVKFIREKIYDNNVETYEQFFTIYLDRRHRITGVHHISKGGIVGTVADIRLILSTALKVLADAIIITHNHPSDNTRPSEADIILTKKIAQACQIHEIVLLDHVIITSDSYCSFAAEDLIGSLKGIKEYF